MKKILSFLLVAIIAFSIVGAFATSVNAFSAKDLLGGGEEGQSFTETYSPTESLTLKAEDGYNEALTTSTDAKEFVIKVVNFALGFLGLLAVIIVIYGGVLYVTAGGEEENTQKGKKSILYATIGLLIVMGSFAFVNTIIKAGGGGSDGGETGGNIGGSYNAAAAEVRNIAKDIYTGFLLVGEIEQDLRSIVSDAQKAPLDYNGNKNWVSKEAVGGFMGSMKSKIKNIRSKVPKFSKAYIATSELIREIEKAESELRVIRERNVLLDSDGNFELTDGGTRIEICGTGNEWEEAFSFGYGRSCDRYPANLFPLWDQKLQPAIVDGTGLYEFGPIYGYVKDYYYEETIANIVKLEEAMSPFGELEAAKAGSIIATSYEKLMFGLTGTNGVIQTSVIDEGAELGSFTAGSFLSNLYALDSESDDIYLVSIAEGSLLSALEHAIIMAEEIEKLQTVQARLRANVTTGKAPLVVTYDILESVDPAGESIKTVDWDGIKGEENADCEYGKADEVDGATESGGDATFYGTAFMRCVYNKPGTYVAKVIVSSGDSSKYIPGESRLTIKVLPPTSDINLKIKTSRDANGIVVSQYENGELTENRNSVVVTSEEAKLLEFDASQTASGTGDVSIFRWDLGTGGFEEGSADGKEEMKNVEEGEYKIRLEVENKIGEKDQKIFTLIVKNIAARTSIDPGTRVKVGETVTFDASASAAVGGVGITYEWTLKKLSHASKSAAPISKENMINLGSNKNKESFTHTFTELGEYEIFLTATSDLGDPSTDSKKFTIYSESPKAEFSYEAKKASQPNLLTLDGTKSYDPDGEKDDLVYLWTIDGEESGENWAFVGDDSSSIEEKIDVKFLEKGEYEVKLTVTDSNTITDKLNTEFGEIVKTIEVNDNLDLAWGESSQFVGQLDSENKILRSYDIEHKGLNDGEVAATAYEIDFGDESISSGEMDQLPVSHTYTKSGKYNIKATIYDDEGNENSITNRVIIGGEGSPLAVTSVSVDGAEILDYDYKKGLIISKNNVIKFDAKDSVNSDGSSNNLKYSWDLDYQEKRSSNPTATQTYKELGEYTVKLKVVDGNDPSKNSEDEIKLTVKSLPPVFSSISATPSSDDADLITPVEVVMKAHGEDDPDGDITQYKWWYYDEDDPDEKLGIQVTKVPMAKLIIGTFGKEGQKITYKFGLELTDSDNEVFPDEDEDDEINSPEIEVKNGPNTPPEATFSVDKTNVFVGDKIMFTSSSKDPDGEIESYIWDFEGDGFSNNLPVKEPTIEHKFAEKNLKGFDVRLKVVDDKGGESTSESKTIYVDSLADEPTAAFKYEVVEGSGGKKINFTNNSVADEDAGAEIISFKWDFDTVSTFDTADSDGDGSKDNDIDSQEENPSRLYDEFGAYTVKLSITDNQGNSDEVAHAITIPLADPPVSAFTYEVDDGVVKFKNNTTADTENGAIIEKHIWDFDTASTLVSSDTDGDGDKTNDQDSLDKDPEYEYEHAGTYQVKLKVIDNQGGEDEVIHEINVTFAGTTPGTEDGDMTAILMPTPVANEDDIVFLTGDAGAVTFDFSKSLGSISNYTIDKNIYYDTDGNGIKDDDKDFNTSLPGTWKTNFEKEWGEVVVQLTVKDIYGNEHTATKEVQFK